MGRKMEVYSSQPTVHLYTGNHIPLAPGAKGKGGLLFGKQSGVCLETQHLPDSPNRTDVPSTVLGPGAFQVLYLLSLRCSCRRRMLARAGGLTRCSCRRRMLARAGGLGQRIAPLSVRLDQIARAWIL